MCMFLCMCSLGVNLSLWYTSKDHNFLSFFNVMISLDIDHLACFGLFPTVVLL